MTGVDVGGEWVLCLRMQVPEADPPTERLGTARLGGSPEGPDGPVVPAKVWQLPEMIDAARRHDLATMFRLLQKWHGLTQRLITRLTGRGQSEISEIMAGQMVTSYGLLVQICDGLGAPRALMSLPDGPWPPATRDGRAR